MTLQGPRALGSLSRRTITIAVAFGATMAIFSPLSSYALVIGWVAAQQSAWLRAATLAAYGLGLMVPLTILSTLAATHTGDTGYHAEAIQERARVVSGVRLALACGSLLSMRTLRATWALLL